MVAVRPPSLGWSTEPVDKPRFGSSPRPWSPSHSQCGIHSTRQIPATLTGQEEAQSAWRGGTGPAQSWRKGSRARTEPEPSQNRTSASCSSCMADAESRHIQKHQREEVQGNTRKYQQLPFLPLPLFDSTGPVGADPQAEPNGAEARLIPGSC